MTSPANLPPAEDHLPDETPEALQGIAARLQHALDELFAVRAEATELSRSGQLSEEDEQALSDSASSATELTTVDRRLYLPASQDWEVRVKSGPREYCCLRNAGEDWFHLLVDGELYLQSGEEKLCLNCAMRRSVLTDDRLFWQTGRRRRTLPIDDSISKPPGVTDSTDDEPLTEGPQ